MATCPQCLNEIKILRWAWWPECSADCKRKAVGRLPRINDAVRFVYTAAHNRARIYRVEGVNDLDVWLRAPGARHPYKLTLEDFYRLGPQWQPTT